MKKPEIFILRNKIILVAMLVGLVLGCLHWYFWGCYWGTYPYSSELWTNCCMGSLFGGFVASIVYDQSNG